MSAVLQTLALVPVVTVYVCGWRKAARGDRNTTTLTRPTSVQCNISQTHIVGLHTRYTKHTAASKTVRPCVAHILHISLGVFPVFDPGILSQPHPEEQPSNGKYIYIYDHPFFRGFGQEFFSSRLQYAIRGTGILGQIASFERRLRGAAPTSLDLTYPFHTST